MARSKTNDQAFGDLLQKMDAPAPGEVVAAGKERESDAYERLPGDCTKQTTIRIRKDLLKLMKHASVDLDRSNTYIINAALEEWLDRNGFRN